MRKKIIAVIQYLFFLGIGIFLSWWQLGKMTVEERQQFNESLLHANYIVILPITILALLAHLSRAMRWKILIEPLGYKPATSNTLYSILCGYLANTFIPRAGEVLRCTLLGRYEKIPVNKLLGTILIERVFDLFCFGIIFIFTVVIQINTVKDFLKTNIHKIANANRHFPVWPIAAALLVTCIIVFFIIKWTLKKYDTHRHIIKIKSIFSGLKEGFTSIVHLKKRRTFLFHTVFIWAMYLAEIYVGFNALQATSGLGITAALSILSLSTIAMIVSPGGIGAFPLGMQEILLIYNIKNISFGWLMWGTTTAIVIVTGAISFALLMYNHKKGNETGQQNSRTDLYTY